MHRGISKALEDGNSFDLTAWADELEEESKPDHALIVRWMARWKRRPRLSIAGRLPDYPIIAYYWMTKHCIWVTNHGWVKVIRGPNEHCLPRVGKLMLPHHNSIATAYIEAVQYLLAGGFAHKLK